MTAHALGERDVAHQLYELIAPYRSHNCVTAGVAFFGNAEHMLGLLAETMDDEATAATHLHRALSRYEEWNAPAYAAVARADLGRVLDNDHHIEASVRVARELGLGVILRRGAGAGEHS
jgi:hypothetical protein